MCKVWVPNSFLLAAAVIVKVRSVRPSGESDSTVHKHTGISSGATAQLQLDEAGTTPTVEHSSKDKRADLCKALDAVEKGKLMSRGLEGAHLTAAVPVPNNAYIYKDKDGKWSGYDYEVLKAVASNAKFTFDVEEIHMEEGLADGDVEGKLVELHHLYDVVLDHNSETASRMATHRIYTVFGMVDASNVLSTQRDPNANDKTFIKKAMAVLEPFDKWVWLSYSLASLCTAALFLFLEQDDQAVPVVDEPSADRPEANKPEADTSPGSPSDPRYYDFPFDENSPKTMALAWYTSLMHTAGLVQFSPRTWPGRILVVSWSVLSIIFVACYTANLASILTMDAHSNAIWHTLDDVIRAGGTICARKSGLKSLEAAYPSYKGIKAVQEYPIKAMVDGKCDAALTWASNLDVSMRLQVYNPKCKLTRVGRSLNDAYGGWSALADYRNKCTVLARDALKAQFVVMQETGELDKLYKEKLLQAEDTLEDPCGVVTQTADLSLDVSKMGGLFLLWIAGAGLAVMAFFTCSLPRSHES